MRFPQTKPKTAESATKEKLIKISLFNNCNDADVPKETTERKNMEVVKRNPNVFSPKQSKRKFVTGHLITVGRRFTSWRAETAGDTSDDEDDCMDKVWKICDPANTSDALQTPQDINLESEIEIESSVMKENPIQVEECPEKSL